MVSPDHRVRLKESEKKDKYQDLTRELKKKSMEHENDGDVNCNRNLSRRTVEHESEGDNNCHRRSWYSHQMIGIRTRELRNKKTIGDNPNYNIAKIGQNIEKNPGELRKLVVIQTPVKNDQLTLMR